MHRFRVSRRILLALAALSVFAVVYNNSFTNVYEKVTHTLMPSPERSFRYGNRHFDATHPSVYDIKLAKYYFEQTALLDENFPNLQHQLARISFLEGDFFLALSRINKEIDSRENPDPASHYIRGLILGYMGRYEESIESYERFLEVYPTDWAAVNDYAWVLLKAERYEDAAKTTLGALRLYPENPWLLNTNAIALHELGYVAEARHQARAATRIVSQLSEKDWLYAYPGNDPRVAAEGVLALQEATRKNMHTIVRASIAAPQGEL